MTAAAPYTPPLWLRYAKALLALAGATPPAAVFAWLDSAGVHAVPPWVSALVTVVCAVAAVAAGPKNAEKS
ncbi:hypothetical protein [Amycolatopsis sp. VC5-11]|uniref:hypothetical protein n=1 Tax=Amycolatopsis sp. VC5-11 TaxID=3120156 RepID=UPI0030088018